MLFIRHIPALEYPLTGLAIVLLVVILILHRRERNKGDGHN